MEQSLNNSQMEYNFSEQSILKTLPCVSLEPLETSQDNVYKKKAKLIEALKKDKFQNMKGSNSILDKIKQHRENIQNKNSTKSSNELNNVIQKQHQVVMQLNQENVSLIKSNSQFKQQIISTNSAKEIVESQNIDLVDQNKCLKDQLSVSQKYSLKVLKDLKESRKEIVKMSQKIRILKENNF